jgi:spectinomycin phosphotransferase
MLTKPPIADAAIITHLRDAYAIDAADLAFLPIGADADSAVYRATTREGRAYFVKLRRGPFDDLPIRVPWFLHQHGVKHVIPPIPTRTEGLWTALDGYTLAVFPFVEGVDGYEVDLGPLWVDLGRALRAIHTLDLPADLASRVRRETYADTWREGVRGFLALAETQTFADPVSADLAALLRRNRSVIGTLVRRADALAARLRSRTLLFVLCHADIHAGNVLIDADRELHIVDWDTVTLAPKERDLMFPGAGLFGEWQPPEREEDWFYSGYGETAIDRDALAYYRCERVVQDIAEFCDQILHSAPDNPDRANGLRLLSGQFLPGAVVDLALNTEPESPVT